MYNCPGSGIPGKLGVFIDRAFFLQPEDDAFVKVIAVDDRRQSETKVTNYVTKNSFPQWKKALDFGSSNWQYIEVSLWDKETVDDRELISSQYFSVNPGHHSRTLCKDIECLVAATFSMSLDGCGGCVNGGTCLADNTCSCTTKYDGPHCEYLRGHLAVTAFWGDNLIDKDPDQLSLSDSFLEIHAYDHHGSVTTKYTSVINNDLNPYWDEQFNFGVNSWVKFTVQALDEDSTANEELSSLYTYTLDTFKIREFHEEQAYEGGSITISYFFTEDKFNLDNAVMEKSP